VKALTLTQPWATLVAIGAKRIETRSWATKYRGPFAIHAAKAFPRGARDLVWRMPFSAVLCRVFRVGTEEEIIAKLPRGAVLATCRLLDCVPTEHIDAKTCPFRGLMTAQERAFGDYYPRRFAWILDNVQQLPESIPAKGALSLWEWNP